MAVLVTYRGLQVLDSASQSGGDAINDDLKALADRSGPIRSDASNPTINDDGAGTAGNGKFYEWSKWRNSTTDQIWTLRDNSTAAADWVELGNWNQSGIGTFGDASDDANAGGYTGHASSVIQSTFDGGFAHGRATGGGNIQTTAVGAIAVGNVSGTGNITSSGSGTFAGGDVNSAFGITSSGNGSFAWGKAQNADIISSGYGSLAGGYTDNASNAITASGHGSFAWGVADAAGITASATNAFQFGPGTNTIADTVQIGDGGLRFSQNASAPVSPQNGDFWVASSDVFVRTNGVSINLTDQTGDWNRSGAGTFEDGGDSANAGGRAEASTYITANANGSFAHGYTSGAGSDIIANQPGATAIGACVSSGQIVSGGYGSLASGYNIGINTFSTSGQGTTALGMCNGANLTAGGNGTLAGGYAHSYAITTSSSGSFAWGFANTGAISATANNAFQLGIGVNATADTVQIGNAGLRFKQTTAAPSPLQNGDFWVASGDVYARTGGSTINLSDTVSDWNRSGAGAFADNSDTANVGGRANAGTFVTASGNGSLAHGYANMAGSDIIASQNGSTAMGASTGGGQILASGYGSLAVGYSNSSSSLTASGQGAVALGMAYKSNITASSSGSFAGGHTSATNIILASGSGSFVWGDADTASISATANNAFQFGPGTNATADTVQIGNGGLRFKQTTAAPGAPQNGDFWVASTNVYARTGGATVNLSAVSSEWNRDGSGTFNDNSNIANVGGSAVAGGSITASGGTGAFAHGNAATTGSSIAASAAGAFAIGQARNGFDILASSNAAFAFGNAVSESITASGPGAFAGGSCNNSNYILASGEGSVALGYAYNTNIIANQPGAFQFGPGTNALAETVQIGNAGLRFKQTTAAPSPLQNGDFWIDSSNVYIRTGGATVNLTDQTGDWNRSGVGTFNDNSDANNAGGTAVGSRLIGSTTATGSLAHGYALNANIVADGNGSFAGGYSSVNAITASGSGSFAWGDADVVAIVASATNTFQFGPGTNTIADTVQVGNAGLRFKQTTGAPATRQDGDFWMNGELFIQTPGLTLESATLGNARGIASIDLQTTRSAVTQVASGNYSVIGGGGNNQASGGYSTVVGGADNVASGPYSTAAGEQSSAHLRNMVAHGGGSFAANGDAQTSICVVRVLSTGVGPLALTLDGAVAGGANSLTIPNNTTWAFDILVTARNKDTDVENAVFKLFGGIKKETTSASAVLIGTVDKTAKKIGGGTSVWDVSVTADVTNGRLLIQAAGEVAHNIQWVARVTLTETTG